VSNLLGNTPMEEAMQAQMDRLGPVPFDDADREFAGKIQATLSEEDIRNDYLRVGLPIKKDTPLCDCVVPRDLDGVPMIGSTDLGDVSWAVPTVQARVATHAIGTPGHSWQITAQGKMPAAHKGMVYAAKVMAGTALDLIGDAQLLQRAKDDYRNRTATTPYSCPIPEEVSPPLQPRPKEAA
jgi:aminobenzoyl-glutamate utilization protein B